MSRQDLNTSKVEDSINTMHWLPAQWLSSPLCVLLEYQLLQFVFVASWAFPLQFSGSPFAFSAIIPQIFEGSNKTSLSACQAQSVLGHGVISPQMLDFGLADLGWTLWSLFQAISIPFNDKHILWLQTALTDLIFFYFYSSYNFFAHSSSAILVAF